MRTDRKAVVEKLQALAERDLFPVLERRYGELREALQQATVADEAEVGRARKGDASLFQVAEIFNGVERQGKEGKDELAKLVQVLEQHFARLKQAAATPQRMARLGKDWRAQSAAVAEMAQTAQRLGHQPDWRGEVSQAHLSVVPKQVEAMRQLASLADTAAESVLLVGALQTNIFDACGLIFVQAVQRLRGHLSQAPTLFYSRTSQAVELLRSVNQSVASWLTGDGTWSPSAKQIAEGLSSASAAAEAWPPAVNRSTVNMAAAGSALGGRAGQTVVPTQETTTTTRDEAFVTRRHGQSSQETAVSTSPRRAAASEATGPVEETRPARAAEPDQAEPSIDDAPALTHEVPTVAAETVEMTGEEQQLEVTETQPGPVTSEPSSPASPEPIVASGPPGRRPGHGREAFERFDIERGAEAWDKLFAAHATV